MRRKYLLFLLLFLIALLGASKFVYDATFRNGLDDLARSSQERLKLIAATLSTRIERFRYLPEVIARSRETEELFLVPDDAGRIGEANRLLERIANASGALALFVTDVSGLTIAASNYGRPGSFVGENYSYRPYFRNALSEGFGRYYAVGATTAQPGYFLSRAGQRQWRCQGCGHRENRPAAGRGPMARCRRNGGDERSAGRDLPFVAFQLALSRDPRAG
ncbi:MAG: hypothetical protein QM711_12535 [Micropruina sp.]|uniref:hypothetical protein n=1 Tax=Micropruina sp. TaxID=2737536 RepID=UPI0039E4EEFD